jgi:hypothetical protein
MDVAARLANLAKMHPRLLWDDFVLATAALLAQRHTAPYRFEVEVQGVFGWDDEVLRLTVRPPALSDKLLDQIQRTYEPPRLVESAAIALAGLALYHAGGHVIQRVAVRGTGADYLVDEAFYPAEIAGRSRASDLPAAWEQRWERLTRHGGTGFYVLAVEFETPMGRLAFHRVED